MWVPVEVGGVPHQAAELEGRALEGVAGRDRVDERVRLGGCRHGSAGCSGGVAYSCAKTNQPATVVCPECARTHGQAHDPSRWTPFERRSCDAAASLYTSRVIFKRVGEGRPYPDHGMTSRAWAEVPPRQVRLDELVTTKDTLQLAALLDEDSTFYGDLFAHVVEWRGEYYLEDGLHRALRAALQQRNVLHARVHPVAG